MIDTKTRKICTHINLVAVNVDGQGADFWNTSFSDEIARLTQGLRSSIEGTNTIFLVIPRSKVPDNK